jgi:hypothetical protein
LKEDLWIQAAKSLPLSVLDRLTGKNDMSPELPALHSVQTVLDAVNKHFKSESDKVWKRRWRSLAKSLSTFNSLVEVGLAFDPTGYGALAWSVVSFGLDTANNHIEIQESLITGCDFIRSVIDEYTLYEARYLAQSSPETSALRSRVIDVYKAVLIYTAEMRHYIENLHSKFRHHSR